MARAEGLPVIPRQQFTVPHRCPLREEIAARIRGQQSRQEDISQASEQVLIRLPSVITAEVGGRTASVSVLAYKAYQRNPRELGYRFALRSPRPVSLPAPGPPLAAAVASVAAAAVSAAAGTVLADHSGSFYTHRRSTSRLPVLPAPKGWSQRPLGSRGRRGRRRRSSEEQPAAAQLHQAAGADAEVLEALLPQPPPTTSSRRTRRATGGAVVHPAPAELAARQPVGLPCWPQGAERTPRVRVSPKKEALSASSPPVFPSADFMMVPLSPAPPAASFGVIISRAPAVRVSARVTSPKLSPKASPRAPTSPAAR
eukprot:TRINITY_DN13171_c0_g1_i1.p1 TRINITY_DN13171_c0_g1~~TRINITY_DN13171_c0_g1_i1.p1  ORF type:complete len:313 (+),score=71.05 TRINITY_DN13171_c0_g1_i1:110-1048(+)